MMNRPGLRITAVFAGFLLVLMACNLTDSAPPPTVPPRATSTPPPTLGFATLAPDEFPAFVTPQATLSAFEDGSVDRLVAQVQPDRLLMHVSALVNMETRHVNSTTRDPNRGIGAAVTYLLNDLNRTRDVAVANGFTVFTQEFPITFAEVSSVGRNIIAAIPGRDPDRGVVVVAAHYDSMSLNYESGTDPAPGANDNASGVAALLEIARILSVRQPQATVLLVAFAAEEVGRLGSIAFVRDYIAPRGLTVEAMLNLDIIGSSTSATGAVNDRQIRAFSADANESRSRQLARSLNLIGSRLMPSMEVIVQSSGDRQGRYGDHLSFSEAGYPAVRFIEMMEEPERHHTTRDTMEDIQIAYLMKSTQIALVLTASLAEAPRPPRSVSLRDAGEGLRTLVWERVPGATGYVVALRAPGSITYNTFFETDDNSVTWEGFNADRFVALAIAAKNAGGMIGPFSVEYGITS